MNEGVAQPFDPATKQGQTAQLDFHIKTKIKIV